jgi:hypothetical protein
MKFPSAKQQLVVGVLVLLAVIVLRRPIAVEYHRLAMRLWPQQADWEAWSRHQHALITLGYFEAREFPLQQRILTNNSDLMRLVDPAPFRDGQWVVTPHSNRVRVTAYRGDMTLWKDIVARFDRAEPDGSANGRQPIRAETNQTSSASAHEGLRRDKSAAGPRR